MIFCQLRHHKIALDNLIYRLFNCKRSPSHTQQFPSVHHKSFRNQWDNLIWSWRQRRRRRPVCIRCALGHNNNKHPHDLASGRQMRSFVEQEECTAAAASWWWRWRWSRRRRCVTRAPSASIGGGGRRRNKLTAVPSQLVVRDVRAVVYKTRRAREGCVWRTSFCLRNLKNNTRTDERLASARCKWLLRRHHLHVLLCACGRRRRSMLMLCDRKSISIEEARFNRLLRWGGRRRDAATLVGVWKCCLPWCGPAEGKAAPPSPPVPPAAPEDSPPRARQPSPHLQDIAEEGSVHDEEEEEEEGPPAAIQPLTTRVTYKKRRNVQSPSPTLSVKKAATRRTTAAPTTITLPPPPPPTTSKMQAEQGSITDLQKYHNRYLRNRRHTLANVR